MSNHKKSISFDGEKAYRHLDYLARKIKNRLAGTSGEGKTISYIKKEFEKLNLKTRLQKFKIITYKPEQASVELLGKKIIIHGEPVGLSKNTPKEGIKGELFIVDDGPDYLTSEVSKKILIMSGGIGGYKKYRLLSEFSLRAVIVVETIPGRDPARIELMPEWGRRTLPIVRISYNDGLKLIAQNGKRVKLICRSQQKEAVSSNVIAELNGSLKTDDVIIVGAHHDSSWEGPGASDNAGGVAVVLELARVFAKIGSKRTIKFISWGAEELGLKGSIYYAKKLKKKKKELAKHKVVVNIDVQGGLIGNNTIFILGNQALTTSANLLSKEIGPSFTVKEDVYSSDGTSLSAIGIPSISFSRGGGSTQFLHSTKDSIEHLGARALKIQGRFIEIWMRRYVGEAKVFPFEKEVPDKLQKKINDYFEKRLGIEI